MSDLPRKFNATVKFCSGAPQRCVFTQQNVFFITLKSCFFVRFDIAYIKAIFFTFSTVFVHSSCVFIIDLGIIFESM